MPDRAPLRRSWIVALGHRLYAWLCALLDRIGSVVAARLPPTGETRELPRASVADRFELEALAGEGGMGKVYRATDRTTGERVALKLLQAGEASDRFEREARVLSDLDHPHIVRYVAHGASEDGTRFLAMEWLEGEDLARRLAPGPLSLERALGVALQVAEALGEAHAHGVVHRDVKPSNIFFVGGELDQVRLLDFGVARRDDAVLRTTTGITVGTPSYMAPEQARGERGLGPSADVFSLGCVLFECLTGRPPFVSADVLGMLLKILLEPAPPLRELLPELPAAIDELVERMLAKDPSRRPADGAAAVVALRSARAAAAANPDTSRSTRAATASLGVGVAERRVTCIALIGRDGGAEVGAARAAVEPLGGRLHQLADGTSLVTAPGDASVAAGDEAARLAHCALAVRHLSASAPLALVAGLGDATDRQSLSRAIERGVELLAKTAGEGGEIALDEAMAALCEARFEVRRGEHATLIGPRAFGARTLLGRVTPCVGRDRELASLEATFATCVAERAARAVLITAPPGAGKTRLAFELRDRLRALHPELVVWTSAADPVRASPPFGLAASALRDALRGPSAVAPRLDEQPPERALFLGELLGAAASGPEPPPLRAARQDPALMSDRIAQAWTELLVEQAKSRPLLLWLDDLQWSDAASVKLLGAALRDAAEAPWMLLALGRPEVHDVFPRLWSARSLEEIRLGELPRAGSVRLIRAVLGDALDERRATEIADRSAGNAFYLEELIRAVAQGQPGALPDSVLAMVHARLGDVPDTERRLLRVASVFGASFPAEGAAELAGVSVASARGFLGELADRELCARIERPGQRDDWSFRHAIVRDAAYAMLTDADRTAAHRLAGQWLERADAPAAEVASHFEQGGEAARAVPLYVEAALRALEASDLEAALSLSLRGASCGASGRELAVLRRVQAEAHVWRGEMADAEQSGLEAMRLAAESAAGTPDHYAAISVVVIASGRLGNDARVLEIAREICAREPGVPDVHALSAAERAAAYLLVSGHAEVARRLLDWLERAADRVAEDDPAMFWVEMADGFAFQSAGDLLGAERARSRLVERSERVGDVRGACMAKVLLGDVRLELGAYREAADALEQAIEVAEARGLFHTVALGKQLLARARASLGELAAARALLADAMAAFTSQQNARMQAVCHLDQAKLSLAESDAKSAIAEAERALNLLTRETPARALALATLALALAAEQRGPEACHTAQRATRLQQKLGLMLEGEATVHLAEIEALRAAYRDEDLQRAATAAAERLEERAALLGDAATRERFMAIPDHERIRSACRPRL